MSLMQSLIRKSRPGREFMKLVPPGHHFRRMEFGGQRHIPDRVFKLLDPFDWACLYILLPVVSFIPLAGTCVVMTWVLLSPGSVWKVLWFFLGLIVTGIFASFADLADQMRKSISGLLSGLRSHLDIDDLTLVMGLSPSELTDLCQGRMRVLAIVLEEVEARTTPDDEERAEPKRRAVSAFNFFRKYDLIPDTSMGRYFTPRPPKIKRT